MLWCPFNTPASAVGVGGGGFHDIRSVGGGAQPLKHPALVETFKRDYKKEKKKKVAVGLRDEHAPTSSSSNHTMI
jgi:hypothetical protein